MENGVFDVKEEEPITPKQYTEAEIEMHSVVEEWNSPPIAFWREKFGSLEPNPTNAAQITCEQTAKDESSSSEEKGCEPAPTPVSIISVEEHLSKNNRRYNLDINSSMLLAHGDVVAVLAESGLGEYTQFYPMVIIH